MYTSGTAFPVGGDFPPRTKYLVQLIGIYRELSRPEKQIGKQEAKTSFKRVTISMQQDSESTL